MTDLTAYTNARLIDPASKTDVRGAHNQGMEVVYVNSGIHGSELGHPLSSEAVKMAAARYEASPTYAAECLAP